MFCDLPFHKSFRHDMYHKIAKTSNICLILASNENAQMFAILMKSDKSEFLLLIFLIISRLNCNTAAKNKNKYVNIFNFSNVPKNFFYVFTKNNFSWKNKLCIFKLVCISKENQILFVWNESNYIIGVIFDPVFLTWASPIFLRHF